jgi:hypothetical protein
MPKRTSSFLEEDNRQEISSLKAVLAQLNTTVAINTEATKGLKEVVEKEFNRHTEDRRGVENRVAVVEARLDNVDVTLAAKSTMDNRLDKVEVLVAALEKRADTSDGWSAGVKWVLGITLAISVPCAGYVIISVLSKVFGFGVVH